MCDNALTVAYIKNEGGTRSYAADVMPAEVVRSQGDNTGSCPSTRSPQHPGRLAVQSRRDTEHGGDDGHGASPTSICPVG